MALSGIKATGSPDSQGCVSPGSCGTPVAEGQTSPLRHPGLNHNAVWDSVFLPMMLDQVTMARSLHERNHSLRLSWILRFMRAVGTIPVDRTAASLEGALNAGSSACVTANSSASSEGTAACPGISAARLRGPPRALLSGAPVIPVAARSFARRAADRPEDSLAYQHRYRMASPSTSRATRAPPQGPRDCTICITLMPLSGRGVRRPLRRRRQGAAAAYSSEVPSEGRFPQQPAARAGGHH